MMSTANFANEQIFAVSFMKYIKELVSSEEGLVRTIDAETFQALVQMTKQGNVSINEMFCCLSRIYKTAKKSIVLIIDEVDSVSNN